MIESADALARVAATPGDLHIGLARSAGYLDGLPVHRSTQLRDGVVITTPGAIVVGTRVPGDVEYAGELARWFVRDGMRDVLAWLGEDVGSRPSQTGGQGARFLDRLRDAS